jgi:hypothetical protein
VNEHYKTELIRQRGPWRTIEQVELVTVGYVWWWNGQRLHGELNYRTPIEVDTAYYAGQESAQPALAGQGEPIRTKPKAIHCPHRQQRAPT